MYLGLLMSHCLSVSLVNRQRPLIQTAYCYCVLAVLCISQIFPHFGIQEVNSKQQQCKQEVGFEPMRTSWFGWGRQKPILLRDKVNRWQTRRVPLPVNLSLLTTGPNSFHPLIFIHYWPQLEASGFSQWFRLAELAE